MKKVLRVTFFLFLIATMISFPAVVLFAQDSTATGPEAVDNIFGIAIPGFVQVAIVALLVLLPAIQFVLKRIPTEGSVKIQGLIGKLLDVLTFFQKDKLKKSS